MGALYILLDYILPDSTDFRTLLTPMLRGKRGKGEFFMNKRCKMIVTVVLFCVCAVNVAADRLELIRYVNLWDNNSVRSSDTSGITYHPSSGRLIIADSEISEYGNATDADGKRIFSGHNIFEVSLDLRNLIRAYFAAPDSGKKTEPTGIAYNPLDGHVYVTDDDRKRILRYRYDDGDRFGSPVAETETSLDSLYTDPEGIGCDPRTGILYVVSGTKEERVLKFRFDTKSGVFVSLGEFSVASHITDPEGIGIDPVTGNVFLVSTGGIAEFEKDGTFVQFFDYSFFRDEAELILNVAKTLPGGLTFAPSSDPNDNPDIYSIYITHRGIDNGAFPEKNTLDGAVSELRLVREHKPNKAIKVPADYPSLQSAIDAAKERDTIIVSPGLYQESLVLSGKALKLVSEHYLTGNDKTIDTTIIDGGGGKAVIAVKESVEPETTISGFTIRNGDDGISAYGVFNLTHCHITETTDGIDYEGGGGLLSYCRFTHNRDDAIDLDGPTAVTIEHCHIEDNGDDGIEIRLHPYSGDVLHVHIRNNRIERNGEDGIQLIDYNTLSDRTFLIEGNVIADNAMVGIGCMGNENTREDYSGAPVPETIHIFNNTFINNSYHLTGGSNLLAVNNIFVHAKVLAINNCTDSSKLTHNLFWKNADTQLGSNIDMKTIVSKDPLFNTDRQLRGNSPAIDTGVADITWQGKALQIMIPAEYYGNAPDLGAFETLHGNQK